MLDKLRENLLQVGRNLEEIKLDEAKIVLKPTGKTDSFDRPIYKDQKGKTFVDVDLGKSKKPAIHTTTRSGEPDIPVKNFTIQEEVEDLDEAVGNLAKLIGNVEGMTDRNDHTRARIEIAKHFKFKKYVKIFTAIEMIQDADQGLSGSISKYQNETTNEMLKHVKTKLSKEDYNLLHGAL